MQDYSDIWEAVLTEIAKEVSSGAYDLWFRDLKLSLLNDKIAVFTAKNDLRRNILMTSQKELLTRLLCETLNYDVDVVVLSAEHGAPDLTPYMNGGSAAPAEDAPAQTETPAVEPNYYATSDQDITVAGQYPPNRDYTFDNFLVGSSNKFAHAAALAVANNASNPTKDYNPLFIYGSSGLGKTHLLYAITNRVLQKNPDAKIVYVKGEEFTNQMIESISNHTTAQFREKFRQVNMLLIDDIQFIAGREATQEEFFHTFNSLYEDGKQIIMTSDRPPRDIKRLEDRLRTRFEWGMIADIQAPNFELRTAIMRSKAERLGAAIPDEVLCFLAENLTDNVRQLEGALKRVTAHMYLDDSPVTVERAREWVSDMISRAPSTEITVDRIISAVAQKYGITVNDIKSRRRSADVVAARHKCIYLISRLTGLSTVKIGDIFNRDHSTVINSLKNIDSDIRDNSDFEHEMNELIDEINRP